MNYFITLLKFVIMVLAGIVLCYYYKNRKVTNIKFYLFIVVCLTIVFLVFNKFLK